MCSWFLYICIICLAAAIVTGAVLLAYFLNTRHGTRLEKHVEPSRNDLLHICDNEACRSAVDSLLLSMDTHVDPCNNFYRYACGHWRKSRSDQNYRMSYEKENRINNTLMFHRALYKLTESPALLDYGERDMALFYRSCYDYFADQSSGKAKDSSVRAILKELGIDEASTRVATFQELFSLALAESMTTGLASLVSAAEVTTYADGEARLRIDVGATLASILPPGYVEGFLDDTFSEWHSGDESRVVLMGQIDESLEKLRTPCLASESSHVTIRDLKVPFPGGDWLKALISIQGENDSSAYSPNTTVSIRGETCIVAMLSHLQRVSVEEARIYSLAVMYAHMKIYAYKVRRRPHSVVQMARKCFKVTAHIFSRTFEAWFRTKILGEDSVHAFATMVDHLKKAAATLPSMPDQLNVSAQDYIPIQMEIFRNGDEDTRKRGHQDNSSGGQRFDEDFLANVVRARKPDVQDNKRGVEAGVLKEGGHDQVLLTGAGTSRPVVAKLLFMTPDLFLPEVSEPVLYYGSSGVALLLQWAAALIKKNENLEEALEQQQRCLQKAASSAFRHKIGDKEGKLVLTTGWALKVAHWAALAQPSATLPDAGQPASAEADQKDKLLAQTRSRLFFLRFCATTCGNTRTARSCKIGVHFSKEFSEAFGCRPPPDYLCSAGNN